MPLTLTPEQERRLTAYAKQRQKPIPAALDDLLPDLPQEATTPNPPLKPKTGKELIAYLEKEQVFGNVFADRPEDAPELARILRAEAERREHE